MINKIDSGYSNTSFGNKVKLVSNMAKAELHYMKFLKAEDEFIETTKVYESQTSDLSLKTITTFGKAVKNFGKMAYERITSAYYYRKG